MTFKPADAVTEESVRNRIEEIVQEDLQFRQIFRQTRVPDGVGSTWKIPQPDDVIGDPDTITPGSSYPATEEDYSKVSINREKIGMKMRFLDEATMDNTSFDVISDQVDRAGRQMSEELNSRAFTELDGNLNSSSPVGPDDGDLARDDYLQGLRTLRGDGYNPDTIVIEEHGEEDLLTDADFTRSTQMGDSTVREGQIARADGMNVVVSNTGDISDADAYIVDSSFYGYEAVWTGVETEGWRDEDTDSEYRKIRTFRQWKAIDSGAAIKVQG